MAKYLELVRNRQRLVDPQAVGDLIEAEKIEEGAEVVVFTPQNESTEIVIDSDVTVAEINGGYEGSDFHTARDAYLAAAQTGEFARIVDDLFGRVTQKENPVTHQMPPVRHFELPEHIHALANIPESDPRAQDAETQVLRALEWEGMVGDHALVFIERVPATQAVPIEANQLERRFDLAPTNVLATANSARKFKIRAIFMEGSFQPATQLKEVTPLQLPTPDLDKAA